MFENKLLSPKSILNSACRSSINIIPQPHKAVCLALLLCGVAYSQTATLSVGPATGAPGNTVTANLTLQGGSGVAGLQWQLGFQPKDLQIVAAHATTTVTNAGKTLQCSQLTNAAVCMIYGIDKAQIPDGIIATVDFKVASTATATDSALTLTNLMASMPDATSDEISGTGNIVKIQPSSNSNPVAVNQNLSTLQNTRLAITLSATDPDGDQLSYSIASNPTHGSLAGTAPTVSYTPSTNYSGSDSFTFRVTDGKGGAATGTVNIAVLSGNSRPSIIISSPSGGTVVTQGTSLFFRGDATDPEDGTISSKIVWTSSVDGRIGTGASFSKVLSAGNHTITASITDSGGLTATRSLSLTVEGATTSSIKIPYVNVILGKRGWRTMGRATMQLLKGDGSPLVDAMVMGYWALNGQLVYEPSPFSTGPDGVAQTAWSLGRTTKGDVISFTITGVKSRYYTGSVPPTQGTATVP